LTYADILRAKAHLLREVAGSHRQFRGAIPNGIAIAFRSRCGATASHPSPAPVGFRSLFFANSDGFAWVIIRFWQPLRQIPSGTAANYCHFSPDFNELRPRITA